MSEKKERLKRQAAAKAEAERKEAARLQEEEMENWRAKR